MGERWKRWAGRLGSWKPVALVAAVGLLLLLWPAGGGQAKDQAETEESRVEALLSRIEGVGEVYVLLSEQGAVVVCQGAGDPQVRLEIKEAVHSYTGLLSSNIMVFQLN